MLFCWLQSGRSVSGNGLQQKANLRARHASCGSSNLIPAVGQHCVLSRVNHLTCANTKALTSEKNRFFCVDFVIG